MRPGIALLSITVLSLTALLTFGGCGSEVVYSCTDGSEVGLVPTADIEIAPEDRRNPDPDILNCEALCLEHVLGQLPDDYTLTCQSTGTVEGDETEISCDWEEACEGE